MTPNELELFLNDPQNEKKPSVKHDLDDKNFEILDRISEQEITAAVETILSENIEQIHPTFYRNIDPLQEFGVSRFVADRIYYLPKLLGNITLTFIQDSTYLVSAESKDPNGNSIKLEHRFKATTEDEASKLFEKIHQQLAGIQLKIWLACWRLGDQLRRYTYNCQLIDLMKIVYPERTGFFSVSDKTAFYEHLKSLEQTKILFSKPNSSSKRKKDLYQTFEIPLLQILSRLGAEEGKYPQELTLSIMNLFPHPGKMAFLGTPFKHGTLALHADDTQLATWIQTRKGQRPEEEFIVIEREFLINISSLQRSNAANKAAANQKLVKKLQRLADKGIIKEAPTKITKEIKLRVR